MLSRAVASQRQEICGAVAVGLLNRAVKWLGAQEDPGERVIVFSRNWVELVVVTLGTGDRDAKYGATGDVDLIVHDLHTESHPTRIMSFSTERQHAGRNQSCFTILGCFVRRFRHEIAGQLFSYKQIVRLVVIERRDHVVAVGPGVRIREIEFSPAGFCKSHHVEPMPTPPFAKPRRGQQSVNKSRQRAAGAVVHKRANFSRLGRQANQIEIQSSR